MVGGEESEHPGCPTVNGDKFIQSRTWFDGFMAFVCICCPNWLCDKTTHWIKNGAGCQLMKLLVQKGLPWKKARDLSFIYSVILRTQSSLLLSTSLAVISRYLCNNTPSLLVLAGRDIKQTSNKEDIVANSWLVFTCSQDDRPRATVRLLLIHTEHSG